MKTRIISLLILAMTIVVQAETPHERTDAMKSRDATDLSNLKTVLFAYEVDNGKFPTTEQGLKALVEKPAADLPGWMHPYIDKLPNDSTGKPFVYRCPGTDGRDFDLLVADDIMTGYSLTSTLKIGGDGGWDYGTVDPATHYLYYSRGTHTQVIDTAAGKLVADLLKCGAHGIALVPELNKGFTSDGRANTVTVFDIKKNAVLFTLPAGKNPDAIIYDPFSKRIFAMDGGSNDITVIDPAAAAPNLMVVAHVPVDGKPEFAAANGAGHLYVNIEDKNEIQDIDLATMTIAHTWKIDGESPSGLAIDVAGHHLFAGCDGKMVIIDFTTGKTVGTAPIGQGVDACGFDPQTREAFASCGDGTLAIIKETTPGKFETVQSVKTKPGARTMALDASTHTIYLASAEMLPKEPSEKRAKTKPDTFEVLVISKP